MVRAGAVTVALLVVAGLAAPGAAASESPPRVAEQAGANPLPARLTLSRVTPAAPQPGDTLRLSGTVRNTSPTLSPLEHLALSLYYSPQPIVARGTFDQYAQRPSTDDFALDGLQPLPAATVTLAKTTLAPGAAESWTAAFPIDALNLTQPWEVYPLGVQATTSDAAAVGRLRTFLPYAPADQTGRQPLSVSWLWPLVDRPHQNVVGGGDVFTDDDLAGELSADGRLTRLLAAATAAADQHPPTIPRKPRRGTASAPTLPRQQVPVAFAVDPMLLAELFRMSSAGSYTVHRAGKSTPGTGRADAAGFISRLKSLLVGSGQGPDSVLALPYADPDVVATVRAGQTEQLGSAYYLGNSVVARVLGLHQEQAPALLSHWAWPPNGYADRSTLDALFSLGVQTLVLDSLALPNTGQPPFTTPNAHVTVSGRFNSFTGVLADDTLSQVVSAGAVTDSGLALQRYLAETLMIQAQSPFTTGRSIVVAPARRWSPPAGYATRLLTDTGRVPWLKPATLAAAAQAPVMPENLARQLTYPRSEQRLELAAHYVDNVGRLTRQVNQLGAVLQPGAAPVRADDEAILQALSSAWRGQRFEAVGYRTALAKAVKHTVSQVRIAINPGSLVTLTSHSGTVPITIFNGLNQAARVGIRLDTAHRLSITGGQGTRTIPPHQRVAVDVRATANVSGAFPVFARLVTPGPDSRTYGHQKVLLYVRSTAYGTAALSITGGAFAVLLIAVGFRLVRRARAARRTG